MKTRYVSLGTIIPVPDSHAQTDAEAITRARMLLKERMDNNPASLTFFVEETLDVPENQD
jgi:hypothetical protein